jgi:hypothetical protein
MRVETPISVHGCYDVVHKCGKTYVITPYDNPIKVEGATETLHPEHNKVRLYTVSGDSAVLNGTYVKGREYHVSTCKLALTTMVRGSAEFVRSWCTYHQKLGADFFFIYDNNSSEEEFKALVEAVDPFPGILFRWTYPYNYNTNEAQCGQQTHSICISKHSVQRLALFDVDEYLVIESGSLNELITPPLIHIFWRWVGTGDIISSDPRDYTRCARDRMGLWYSKAICNPLYASIGLVHNAHCPDIVPVKSESASLYHFRGLSYNTQRKCDMSNHANCPYCEIETDAIVQIWKRSN